MRFLIKPPRRHASERLKNTTLQLREQDAMLRQALVDASWSYGLAVIGYSGRDASVMDTLRAAIVQPREIPLGASTGSRAPRRAPLLAVCETDVASGSGRSRSAVRAIGEPRRASVLARHVTLPDASEALPR